MLAKNQETVLRLGSCEDDVVPRDFWCPTANVIEQFLLDSLNGL